MPNPPSPSAHLLHADEDQLDRAAMLLSSGTAFIVAVCPAELRKAALERLRGRMTGLSLPDPVEVGSPEESMVALIEQAERRDRVLSLVLGRDVEGALDGLNLHREKVVRGGPVILWLEDVAALVKMRERAPDAFSFRSTMVVVRGDGGLVQVTKGEEPEAVTRGHRRLKRARMPLERAAAGHELAETLRSLGRYGEAEPVARAALNELGSADSEDAHRFRVGLCRTLSAIACDLGMTTQEFRWKIRALAENMNVAQGTGIEAEAQLRATFPGPLLGVDRASVQKAMGMVRSYGLGPEVRAQALRMACLVAVELGDFAAAREFAQEYRAIERHLPLIDRAHAIADFASLEIGVGDLVSAESCGQQALAAVVAEGGVPYRPLFLLSECFLERSEIDAALSVLKSLPSDAVSAERVRAEVLATIALRQGNVAASLDMLREATHAAAARHADGSLVDDLANLAIFVEQASESERFFPAESSAAQTDMARGETTVVCLASPDGPPWYPVQLLSLRARVLSRAAETLPQALDLAHQARDLARATYPDLLPETGRSLADHLLRAAKPDEALTAISDVEPYASDNGFLKERARLLADRVLALVQRGDAPAVIEPHLTALRAALAATDSPRIMAETLRDLAIRLPPTASTPDPLALAEEVHPLFVAMPMPAEDARCLELMGDVLLARGRPDEAKRRYLTARARLQRYGLGLRLPLLDRKISALG